jgi:hypothetical protein
MLVIVRLWSSTRTPIYCSYHLPYSDNTLPLERAVQFPYTSSRLSQKSNMLLEGVIFLQTIQTGPHGVQLSNPSLTSQQPPSLHLPT